MTGAVAMSLFSIPARAFLSQRYGLCQTALRAVTSQANDEQLVQDMLYRLRRMNYMPPEVRSSLLEFQVDGISLGKVKATECFAVLLKCRHLILAVTFCNAIGPTQNG